MKNSFTMIETIVVVVISAIVVLFATAQFFRAIEKARASEAVMVLHLARGAQLRYAADHATTADQLEDLDIELTSLKHFAQFQLFSLDPESNSSSTIAQLERTLTSNAGYGQYILAIDSKGNITCSNGQGDICAILGF